MSNNNALKTFINNTIYENNTQQITGAIMNTVLNSIVNTLGAGYQFAGVANVGMNPSEPDARVFYLASAGIYTNFGGIEVPQYKLGVLKWDTSWHLETIDGLGGGSNLTGYISVASVSELPEVGQPTLGYLIGTSLFLYVGEGGDTANGKYKNCGPFRGPQGNEGGDGVGITDISQIEQSYENGGINIVRITTTDGNHYDVNIRNGKSSSGLFPDVATLNAQRPNPSVGEYAFVGSGFPAELYVCNTEGTWTDSGEQYGGDSIDLTEYATKAEVTQLEAEVHQLAGKFYGVFADDSDLPEGDAVGYAFVGTENPYAIWNFDGEEWSDSGSVANGITGEPGVGFSSIFTPDPYDGTVIIVLSNNDTITLDLNHNHPAYYSKVAETSNPSGGFLPDVVYALGTLTGTVAFTLAAAVTGNVNHYFWMFDTGSTAPTITWPTGITWAAGAAPTVAASKHYEISVLNGIAYYSEV